MQMYVDTKLTFHMYIHKYQCEPLQLRTDRGTLGESCQNFYLEISPQLDRYIGCCECCEYIHTDKNIFVYLCA